MNIKTNIYRNLKPRVPRRTYFWNTFLSGIVFVYLITRILNLMEKTTKWELNYDALLGILILLSIINCWHEFRITKRRLHDLDMHTSALLLLFVPIANLILGLRLLFERGTSGPNDYGEDPLMIQEEGEKSNSETTAKNYCTSCNRLYDLNVGDPCLDCGKRLTVFE